MNAITELEARVRHEQAPATRLDYKRFPDGTQDKANGLYTPILWHLALGQDYSAMTTLADTFDNPGRISETFSKLGLCYRAHRGGHENASQHLAMEAFNRGDLQGYRHWLHQCARFGDLEANRELKRFETRLPHKAAATIRRQRPYRKDE